MKTKKQKIQEKVFNISNDRDLTADEVREAIVSDSNLALCQLPYAFAGQADGSSWCLTEVDTFFPDDDYVSITKEVAEQIIAHEDICRQVLEGIDIYRRV